LGKDYTVVVVKSTVPPGTTERVGEIIEEFGKKKGKDFDVVDSPEFLAEGRAVRDTQNPSRIIIGTDSDKSVKVLKKLFKSFKNSPVLVCDIKSAELIKYASNSFLATKVSFINEISQIAEKFGADVTKVAEGMGLDDRIGPKFLRAGLGYGGSCFPKDVASLLFVSNHAGYEFGILRSATEVNRGQHKRFVKKIKDRLGGLKGKKIAVLGLAFKPQSDDMRKAVSVDIIRNLLKEGANVSAYDPVAMGNAKLEDYGGEVEFTKGIAEALKGADCLALVTEWEEFSDLDWEEVKNSMRGNLIADGRNLYDPYEIKKAGFEYVGVGRV
jgi:UDPglucose 6-dehydrogenase